ncbi:hybrid sensor histidine kinase/response regulator [Shewanella marina]|uniref:hybrid sensor histidine kinase/response regulator n=1 Tax=Shewanella marina TaxID=487319 RepID=UPI000470E525|nr:PAS domain-containing hybrid sensor histidine kinase/response regulator [Shewanella marina]
MNLTLLVAVIAIVYVFLLFVLAWAAERWGRFISSRLQVAIYGLSLAVYCSSWSFLGTVGQSSNNLWSFTPIFIAPILLFVFGFSLLKKLVRTAKAHNITSVADFIAARYGKSQFLAVLVTFISLFGIMPYIALQLKAMMLSFGLFIPSGDNIDELSMGLIITVILAIFSILFGTRKLDATEHNPGLMFAIAFESLVKLSAFLLVGIVIIYGVYNGIGDVWQQFEPLATPQLTEINLLRLLPEIIVGMAAFLCMPRQFHVMVVECPDPQALAKSRWILPVYLLLFALFIPPLALAGQLLLGDSVPADTYVISIPLALDHPLIAIIALLGTISAATGMMIVAVVTISIMVSNEWVVPLMLRSGQMQRKNFDQFSHLLLNIRRIVIILIFTIGFISYMALSHNDSLSDLGMMSFGAFAQLAPALVGGLYWQHGNRYGVILGLAVGFGLWCTVLVRDGLGVAAVTDNITLLQSITPNVRDILLALLVNCICYILGSLWFRSGVVDRIQASSFVTPGNERNNSDKARFVSQQELLLLAGRFISPARVEQSYAAFELTDTPNKAASAELIAHTEHLLSGILGATSAALVLNSVMKGRDLALDEVFELVDDASSQVVMSQDMLRAAIEHAYEGMSVIDSELNLVAWNYRYVQLYHYPDGFLKVGLPIAEVIRFNARRGFCGEGEIEAQVQKRLQHMRNGSAHTSERRRLDGKVIKIQGNPMPKGGFVMTFTDITQYRLQEQALRDMNITLEARVAERTSELAALNQALTQAKQKEEQANASKSRFLAAVGHDLMQPLNAARLFTASLAHDPQLSIATQKAINNVNGSLKAAGELLTDLLDISRLDSGLVKVNRKDFYIAQLIEGLSAECIAMQDEFNIHFSMLPCKLAVNSDPILLRRIVQNFLTNAYRYAKGGRVVLGCRRKADGILIQVLDTGCGIEQAHLQDIFTEFKRVSNPHSKVISGLGLGLAISDRISKELNHPITVDSEIGKGSVFSVFVPLAQQTVVKPVTKPMSLHSLAGISVLCIDNEPAILAGLESLLTRWQCEVICVPDLGQARIQLGLKGIAPDIVLADYHLDAGCNGVDAMDSLREMYGTSLPGVLMSANNSQELIDEVHAKGYHFLAKMIKPAALKALILSLTQPN